MPTTLLVFSRDLRLDDHPALHAAADLDQPLVCLYCLNEAELIPNRYGMVSMGKHRLSFLYQSLQALDQQLRTAGQSLVVTRGKPEQVIGNIIRDYDVNQVLYTQTPGTYERQLWQHIRSQYRQVNVKGVEGFTLLSEQQIPDDFSFPSSFSRFRRKVETLNIDPPLTAIQTLPPPLRVELDECITIPNTENTEEFSGGSSAAHRHLADYFNHDSNYPSHYKQTRNALDGWPNSCKLSPWLANGSLSVKHVVRTLQQYESNCRKNDSTEWIYLELLWREYFQWYSYHYNDRLFYFKGIGDKKPLTSFYPQRFKQWCQGHTPWPLVNACMRQLNATGFMSNRGRQIVASCFINELQLDWRYGAAYFEQMLIDYDVATNWGNWQYIAGVGADPRGGRHFNIDKQTDLYDPQGDFIQRWQGDQQCIPIDSLDAADWPIA